MFCEGVQHQNGDLSVSSSIMEIEKSLRGPSLANRVGGDESHVFLGQKIPSEKRSVSWCVVIMQQSLLLSPKFRVNPSHIFTKSLLTAQ
jgi:hypothetical protein